MHDDVEAIHRLAYAYAWQADAGEDAWTLYVEDAVFDLSAVGGPRLEGREAIKAYSEGVSRERRRLHLFSNPQVEVDGDRGSGRWAAAVWEPDMKGGIFLGLAYHDEYVRTVDGWRFASRTQRFLVPPAPLEPDATPGP